MLHPDTFVGSLAIALAVAIGLSAVRPSQVLTVSKSVTGVRSRFGEPGVRVFLVLVASLLLAAGVMILRDFRPSIAMPQAGSSGSDSGIPVGGKSSLSVPFR
jgi:hypothetical protein